jgi:hypothetical protein
MRQPHSTDNVSRFPVDEQSVAKSDDLPPPRRRLRASDVVLGAAVGALVTFAAIVVVVVLARRHTAPPLTADVLADAQERWRKHGPADYRMDVIVTGRQASRYHVEVSGGKPTRVLRDDRSTTARTWHYWTVPGLFEVLEHDMECSDDPTRGFGAQPGSQAVLRAVFDSELGYPRKFERLILGEPNLDMTWEITLFEPFEDRPAE